MKPYFETAFADNSNCLLVQEFECGECQLRFLTDRRGGIMNCPDCSQSLEARGSMVINRGVCGHNAKNHGHEYHL